MTATFYVGDAIEVMNSLPENSVDLVLSSPPFLALRSYLPSDHPDKAKEGGSQATPGEYIDWLLDVVETCARVLAPHGSLCFELGDTYSGSGGAGGDYAADGLRKGQPRFRQGYQAIGVDGPHGGPYTDSYGDAEDWTVQPKGGTGWPLAKSLSLIPESFRWAMVYGVNPFTGRQTAPWRLRNVIRWVRPNPPVGSLGDKFRPATSELMVFCKAKDRFFDLDAVREPAKPYTDVDRRPTAKGSMAGGVIEENLHRFPHVTASNPAGAPPLDWWNIPLLEGEEPTRYGPKDKVKPDPYATVDEDGKPIYKRFKPGSRGHLRPEGWAVEGTDGDGSPSAGSNNPAGAPPLDWWNIPLLDGEEPTRYGPKPEAKATNAGPLRSRAEGSKNSANLGGDTGTTWAPGERMPINPNGPPPLDWWKIDGQWPEWIENVIEDFDQPVVRAFLDRLAKDRPTHEPRGNSPLDWWNIPPGGYPGAHYAVWPPELLVKPIKAMCPEKVCRVCGEPSRRLLNDRTGTNRQPVLAAHIKERRKAAGFTVKEVNGWFGYIEGVQHWESVNPLAARVPNTDDWPILKERLGLADEFDDMVYGGSLIEYRNVNNDRSGWTQNAEGRMFRRLESRKDRIAPDGFTDCGHDAWRPGVVLDPFVGSGTTLMVATGHGRDAIGIDLDERNYDLALQRVGPFILERAS